MAQHKIAISTVSMGWHELHTLDDKLNAVATHGYEGVELFWTDLEQDAERRGTTVEANAARIRSKCNDLSLEICSLSSFDNYEGSQTLSIEERLDKARRWARIARTLGSPLIQIPANDDAASPVTSSEVCIQELQSLAELADDITWAYEPMAWSARASTWQDALATVRKVDRPNNFKLCLDTYHILAKLWGDCRRDDGLVPGGQEALAASLAELTRTVRPDEIAFVQLSDAERMVPPVTAEALERAGKVYSHYWCTWGRLFPFEEERGAYLPVGEICNVLLKEIGWSGWVSQEIFHREMREADPKPDEWAERGMVSWRKVKRTDFREVGESFCRSEADLVTRGARRLSSPAARPRVERRLADDGAL